MTCHSYPHPFARRCTTARRISIVSLLMFLVLAAIPIQAQDSGPILLREAFVIGGVGQYGRRPIHVDAIEKLIVAGTWEGPEAEGDVVVLPDGTEQAWQHVTANEGGWIQHDALRGGYAYCTVVLDEPRIMLLHAQGNSSVYVNGRLRAGDPYRTGFVRLPVSLQAGRNEFLFVCGRGQVRAELTDAAGDVFFNPGDRTLPSLLHDEPGPVCGGLLVCNASAAAQTELLLRTSGGPGLPTYDTLVPRIEPFTVRKVAFWTGGLIPDDVTRCNITVSLIRRQIGQHDVILDTTDVSLDVTSARSRHRRTFVSDIDGSVQYYAVTPGQGQLFGPQASSPGLIMTLHGAGVQASGQAAVYGSKPWAHVVAPTNRRPFGFDWEDWGRLDFQEVFARAVKRYDPDPARLYLTGHSMGGHGTWQIGATLPDAFAAIGPSAGWTSFWSYVGAAEFDDSGDLTIPSILMRAVRQSDTLALARNYLHYGIYILHGEKDDNVPATEAHAMVEHLSDYHPDFMYHEEPGAGHWWGNRCCDWPPMMEFFEQRARPADAESMHVEFVTVNPASSSASRWCTINSQLQPLQPSRVVADYLPSSLQYNIVTENIATMAIDAIHPEAGRSFEVVLDGQAPMTIEAVSGSATRLWFERDRDSHVWSLLDQQPPLTHKGAHRAGQFKAAFRNHMVFVYGTNGTFDENDWAREKARYDAETFWYRGNGSVDVIPDHEFDAKRYANRNVILYGHADMNAAWESLLAESPVQAKRGRLTVGQQVIDNRDDLLCLFIRPRPDSNTASVGVICGTGVSGMRLADRLPYFVSGIGYPDCLVMSPDVLQQGADAILVAGFFGNDWSVGNGEFAWNRELLPPVSQ